jgi:hypothetical protein
MAFKYMENKQEGHDDPESLTRNNCFFSDYINGFSNKLVEIWKQSYPSEVLITTKLQENCRVELMESS